MPPPSVTPAIPVVEAMLPVLARPKAFVAWSKSAQVAPPSARTVRRTGSTCTLLMVARSTTRPPSHIEKPGTLCPPPRTATSRSWARAKLTAAITSATAAQRTMSAGWRSIIPL
jgi:hypothetical protein